MTATAQQPKVEWSRLRGQLKLVLRLEPAAPQALLPLPAAFPQSADQVVGIAPAHSNPARTARSPR